MDPGLRRDDGKKMKLKNVAITGADDAVKVEDLNDIAREYPFVEWALLYMPERAGKKRFPTEQWIRDFDARYRGHHKAMHLCGGAFLDFAAGKIPDIIKGFKRIQLNLGFGNVEGKYDPQKLLKQIKAHPEHEFVIQYTDKRKNLLPALAKIPNHALLFDGSAGTGVLPGNWPAPLSGHFCGYAGGLKPENIKENIEKIAAAAGNYETWIDMESGVRTNDEFDLQKVRKVLDIAAPFVS